MFFFGTRLFDCACVVRATCGNKAEKIKYISAEKKLALFPSESWSMRQGWCTNELVEWRYERFSSFRFGIRKTQPKIYSWKEKGLLAYVYIAVVGGSTK